MFNWIPVMLEWCLHCCATTHRSDVGVYEQVIGDTVVNSWHRYHVTSSSLSCIILQSLVITLHAKLSGAVYCNRFCLWVCGCVCWSVSMVTRNCMHQSAPNWVWWRSMHQLIKFRPSCTPGKGVCSRAKIFGSALLQPVRSVCVCLSSFFMSMNCILWCAVKLSDMTLTSLLRE